MCLVIITARAVFEIAFPPEVMKSDHDGCHLATGRPLAPLILSQGHGAAFHTGAKDQLAGHGHGRIRSAQPLDRPATLSTRHHLIPEI